MDSNAKACIISCGVGGWYSKGIERLERSLIYHGNPFDTIFWKDEYPPDSPTHKENPYAFKVYAFKEAIRRGYRVIIWLDASMWCINHPMKLFDAVAENGYYFFQSGYNCAQSCNDKILKYAGLKRDEAEKLSEFATGTIGLHFDNEIALTFFNRWEQYMKDGMFKGSRLHDNQSKDKRFMFHRQDQSAASIVANLLAMQADELGNMFEYYGTQKHATKNLLFFIKGM